MSSILLALGIGAAFGATPDRIGSTRPDRIGKLLALKHLHRMKEILPGVGSVLIFAGQMVGLVDVAHLSVKASYIGVLIGSLLLAVVWAAPGYCPGTGICAAASGCKDTLFFISGGILGAAACMATCSA